MTPYYERDGIAIYLGDARDILPTLEPVDLLLTDPPYGIGEAGGKNKSRSKPFNRPGSKMQAVTMATDYGDDDWDDEPIDAALFDLVRESAEWQIIFGGNYYRLPPTSCWLVWDKDNGASDFADCELAWTNLRKAVRRLKWRWAGMLQENMGRHKEVRFHPTQKPLEVMKWALSHAPADVRTILDPFMGSGTTLLAAKEMGKRAIGIEREEKYCKVAVERLAQGLLFSGPTQESDGTSTAPDLFTKSDPGIESAVSVEERDLSGSDE